MWLGDCEAPPRPATPRSSQDRMGGGSGAHAAQPTFGRPVPMTTTPGSYASARTRTGDLAHPRCLPASRLASSCRSAVRRCQLHRPAGGLTDSFFHSLNFPIFQVLLSEEERNGIFALRGMDLDQLPRDDLTAAAI